jgi:hypothetical protein
MKGISKELKLTFANIKGTYELIMPKEGILD